MRCLTRLIAFVHFLGSTVLAQSSTASFQYPPSNNALQINSNDALIVTWTSNFNQTWLYMWCAPVIDSDSTLSWGIFSVEPSGSYIYLPTNSDGSQMAWPVPCHLELVYNTTANQGVGGPSLTINSSRGVPTTYAQDVTITASGSATVTVTPAITPLRTTPPIITPSSLEATPYSYTSSAQSATETTPSSTIPTHTNTVLPLPAGLSPGAKAGIGAGVAVGSLLVLAVIAFAVLQRKKMKKLKDRLSLSDNRDVPYNTQTTLPPMEQKILDSKREVVELAAVSSGEEEVFNSHELEAPIRR